MNTIEANTAPAPARQARKTGWLIALLVAAGAALAVWWLGRDALPPVSARTTAAVAPPQPVVVAKSAISAAAPAAQSPAGGNMREALQRRLDALALGYVEGDTRAVERAMWPNHAVIRPDGEKLERRELLTVWEEEWRTSQNRDLKFHVESLTEDGDRVIAVWTILLTLDAENANGDTHHLMIDGRQQATIVRSGEEEMLEGPIEYTTFERTLDGNVWPL